MPTPQSTTDIYRKRAKHYDVTANLYSLIGVRMRKYRRLAVEALALAPGDTVVELGCGTGLNFPLLMDVIGAEGQIIGVDIADTMLEQAKQRIAAHGWNNVTLVLSDIADYTMPRGVDGILSTGVISYSPDYDTVIKRGYDALQPGKRFVIFDLKMTERPTRLFAPLLRWLVKPFGVDNDYVARHPWESIQAHFDDSVYQEGYGGFLYLSVGIKSPHTP